MKYMVVKIMYKKFTYYLDQFNNWQGLKDHAKQFSFKEVEEKVSIMQRRCSSNEEVKYVEVP